MRDLCRVDKTDVRQCDVVQALYSKCGLVKEMRRINMAIYQKHKQWAQKWEALMDVVDARGIVAILGNRGSGKTAMAVAAMKDQMNQGIDSYYCKLADFFIDIKDSFDRPDVTQRSVIERYASPQVLVVDEAHNRSESQWENTLFTHLVDVRYDAKRTTIMISNQKRDEFRKSVGASIYDRLCETGGVIECGWGSFRKTDEQQKARR